MKKVLVGLYISSVLFFSSFQTKLPSKIKNIINNSLLKNAHYGLCVYDCEKQKYSIEKNSSQFFTPASNTKLFTTAAALHYLGPDYTFSTSFYYDVTPRNGIVDGNIIIYGRGDPTLTTSHLKTVAAFLKDEGITEIRGNIIVDDSYFDALPLSPQWEIGDVCYDAHGVEVSALSCNQNHCLYKVIPFIEGQPPLILVENSPHALYNNALTVSSLEPSSLVAHTDLTSNNLIFEGAISLGDNFKIISAGVHDSARVVGTLFKNLLSEMGVIIRGNVIKQAINPLDYYEFITLTSPPLSEIVRMINKDSNNLYAEMVLYHLGVHSTLSGNVKERGIRSIKNFISLFSPYAKYAYNDGSGLSRYNLFSPHLLVELLHFISNQDYAALFIDSLPLGGCDGTLQNRFNDFKNISLSAKTGSLTHVSSLSGYATTDSGRPIIFSFIVDDCVGSASEIQQTIDRVISYILTLS